MNRRQGLQYWLAEMKARVQARKKATEAGSGELGHRQQQGGRGGKARHGVVSLTGLGKSRSKRKVTVTPPVDVNDTVEMFLLGYSDYCERKHRPRPSNVRGLILKHAVKLKDSAGDTEWNITRSGNESNWEDKEDLWYRSFVEARRRRRSISNETDASLNFVDSNDTLICDCVPDTLVGHTNVSVIEPLQIGELELELKDVRPGGVWYPPSCYARHRVAIIIPFRDREEHLRMLLNILHPMLQRQQLHYSIFVIQQSEPAVFNKASLMNVGFIQARSEARFDCYIFHDVDMLPEDDRNFYTCSDIPRHVGSHINKWDYTVPYEGIFGGVTAFRQHHFETINGFSNQYYGWGGEDDDMYSSSVAWKYRPKQYAADGLNTLRYKIISVEERPLYVWILVTLPPHPPYFKPARGPSSVADSAGRRLESLTTRLPLIVVVVSLSRFVV